MKKDKKPKAVEIEKYNKRIDFHRSIHRVLDDGALIAICEDYGEPEGEESVPGE